MGKARIIGSGIVGMLLMVPTAYICFVSFDLIYLITGGLIKNFSGLAGAVGEGGQIIIIILGVVLGILIICLFPIHWALLYHPDNILLFLALILPWIITCFITSYIFSHSWRGGVHTSLAIGVGFFILMLIPYILLSILLSSIGGAAIIDGIATGLTGLPWVLAALAATMEGAGIGAVFGGLAGTLKYKSGGSSKKSKKKKKKSKESSAYVYEPTLDSSTTSSSVSESEHCNNCGAKLIPGDDFCTNCATKM